MSELKNAYCGRDAIRWKLLTGVSILALTGYVFSSSLANAGNSDNPQVWIEIDGQFALQGNGDEIFLPGFVTASPFGAASQSGLEKLPPTTWNLGGNISFEPKSTDWVVSFGGYFGRNSRSGSLVQQTQYPSYYGGLNAYQRFHTQNAEKHIILDFRAGKDIGIGKSAGIRRSVLSLGVRYAQFKAQRNVGIESQPTNAAGVYGTYHKFYASLVANRKFEGIGPSITWGASATLAGEPSSEDISLDWGVNAAALFGRQTASGRHQTTNLHVVYPHRNIQSQYSAPISRARNVVVPNLGGFAAVSWNYEDAKVSFGYRADFFFGAMDGGVDTRKTYDRDFHGPFATISIGLGG